MAYGIIQFVERGQRRATLVRPTGGQPTGADGVMDPLSRFIEDYSPVILREGSAGAEKMAMLFFTREKEAGLDTRVLGAEGELGISAEELDALEGNGHFYEVDFGPPGERSVPSIHARGIERREG
jgi:hypothetical protein